MEDLHWFTQLSAQQRKRARHLLEQDASPARIGDGFVWQAIGARLDLYSCANLGATCRAIRAHFELEKLAQARHDQCALLRLLCQRLREHFDQQVCFYPRAFTMDAPFVRIYILIGQAHYPFGRLHKPTGLVCHMNNRACFELTDPRPELYVFERANFLVLGTIKAIGVRSPSYKQRRDAMQQRLLEHT